MKRVGYLWILVAFCLFAAKPSLAWWTVLYPDAASQATIEKREETEENEKGDSCQKGHAFQEETLEEFEIKWKLVEWFTKWF